MRQLQITADYDGERADSMIARVCPDISRSAAARLFDDGQICLCGARIKKNYRVTRGDILLVTLPSVSEAKLSAQELPIDVVWEDDDLIVINKPRGMVVHPAPGHPNNTLVNALLYHCGDSLSGIGGITRPGIVHRLDKDTSGLIIAAKNDFSHRELASQLRDRSLTRVYEAVARGCLRCDNGTIDAPIGRHHTDRKRMAVSSRANARTAVTDYEVLARYSSHTHILCRLQTGRTHQIRVHMAHIGHPLLGDQVYGSRNCEMGLSGQCLHARRIKFCHPRSGNHIELQSELPAYFLNVLNKLSLG